MSPTWKSLPQRHRALATEAAAALVVLDELSSPDLASPDMAAAAPAAMTFRDLWHWLKASDGGPFPTPVRRALMANPRLRRDLDRLLMRTARWHGPRAAAASSGRLEAREGAGFQIHLKPSRAAADQVYIQIALSAERGHDPITLVVCTPAGDCLKLNLPRAQAGVVQILTDETAEVVRALRDPKSELYLW